MIGTILDGRYRVLRRLGTGGMGEVYLGEHLELHRREAIKVLKAKLAQDPRHLARFRREARATNRVQHPNIVTFYDFGELPDGRLYLTTEFADGPNLEEVIAKEGRLDVSRAAHILRQLAEAVDYAHSMGVIHRDLKPQNLVIVQETGRPDLLKILDFGVAKITAPGYLESVAITREGQVFGTPAYVAPEQIRGVRDDPRSDIYAMGCIAYELVTGEMPFMGRSMVVLEAHLSDEPVPPSRRCLEANIPAQFEQIIMDCLVKDPEKRLQNGAIVAELINALRLGGAEVRGFQAGIEDTALYGFEAASTVRGFGIDSMYGGDDDASTTDVFASRNELELRKVLRSMAEAICDLGCSDPMVLVTLAESNQSEQELQDIRGELAELARSDEAVARKGREREASLRFALAELKFSRDRNHNVEQTDQAIAALTTRLNDAAEQVRLQHATITEKQIDKTAERAVKYEELKEIDSKLAMLIDEHMATFRDERINTLQTQRSHYASLIKLEEMQRR